MITKIGRSGCVKRAWVSFVVGGFFGFVAGLGVMPLNGLRPAAGTVVCCLCVWCHKAVGGSVVLADRGWRSFLKQVMDHYDFVILVVGPPRPAVFASP